MSSDIALTDERLGWWKSRVPLAVALPLVLFVVLQPEAYSTKPNGLDPFFYTGYAINFDDILPAIGESHYFVSRWSAYMPGRVFTWLFGPFAGRLVLRWVVATTLLLVIWHIGRRWQWDRKQEAVIGVVVLTTPMFVRAYLTDYVEWIVVAAGLVLVSQCLERTHPVRSVAMGVTTAAIGVANPLALAIAVGPIGVYTFRRDGSRTDRSRWGTVALHLTIVVVAIFATVYAGKFWYDWRYGIDVYQPTIDFLRSHSEYRDPLKSPSHSWMKAFVWIYAPPILLAAWVLHPSLRARLKADTSQMTIAGLLIFQYAFQWIDQFGRHGNGLEISYYWSFICPTFLLACAVLIGSVTWTWRTLVTFLAAWWLLLIATAATSPRLPGGLWYALITIALVLALTRSRLATPAFAVSVLLLFLLASQVASPAYRPPAEHGANLDPRYDEVFYTEGSTDQLREAIWLDAQLDEIDDTGMFFLGIGNSTALIGTYGPHVTGHWLQVGPDGGPDPSTIDGLRKGGVGRVAVLGPRDFVDRMLDAFADAGVGKVVMLRDHTSALRYTLAVVEARHRSGARAR